MMKKLLCISFCVLSLLITGCAKADLGKMNDISQEQLAEKMDNKDSFIVVFTQPTCGYCNEFKEMLEDYLPDHGVTLYDLSIDRKVLSEEELDELLEKIHVYFPDMSSTPDLYYVKDGEIVSNFDADKIDLNVEENFNAWIDQYELNTDKDYTQKDTAS